MKHAYLIIAHTEFDLLKLLISSLDDERNDIYIHIDRKVSLDGLELITQKSRLFMLTNRLDARWGDYSLVEIELNLFQEAYERGPYAYYHLLSGVDLPIKTQDYIHNFCDKHQGVEFVGIAQNVPIEELIWRSQHWFIFSRDFRSGNVFKKLVRALFARCQTLLGYHRTDLQIKKGAQWCSITNALVAYLLQNRNLIYRCFNHTYCPDELFIQTLCWNSSFKNRLYSTSDEFEGCMRYIKWIDGKLSPIGLEDIELMKKSNRWFARKFTISNKDVVFSFLNRVKMDRL